MFLHFLMQYVTYYWNILYKSWKLDMSYWKMQEISKSSFTITGQKYPKIAKVHPHPAGYKQPIQYKMLKESITSSINLKYDT